MHPHLRPLEGFQERDGADADGDGQDGGLGIGHQRCAVFRRRAGCALSTHRGAPPRACGANLHDRGEVPRRQRREASSGAREVDTVASCMYHIACLHTIRQGTVFGVIFAQQRIPRLPSYR